MAVPLRYRPTPLAAAKRVRARAALPVVDPGFRFNAGAPDPYVRPRITGMVVGDEPIPPQRPSFGGPGGVLPGAGAPPATTPPPPGQVPLPPPGGGTEFGVGPIPGRGMGALSWNPQLLLPDTALAKAGALDSQYTTDKNAALSEFYNKYHTTLRALGYMDAQGHPVTGSIDQNYQTQHALGIEGLSDEERRNTEGARDLGTLFSGVRAQSLLDAQRQTVRDLGDLDITTEGNTIQGYTDIGDARDAFNSAIQQAIANAIYRKTGSYNYSFNQPG